MSDETLRDEEFKIVEDKRMAPLGYVIKKSIIRKRKAVESNTSDAQAVIRMLRHDP